MSENLNLSQKVVKIMSEVSNIGKGAYNENQKYWYTEAVDVIREVRKQMLAYQLRLRSEVTSIDRQPCGKMTLATIMIQYTLIDTETGEIEITHMIAEGADIGDKAINKAMTSGLKYFFRDTFMLEFADDPEQESPKNNNRNQKQYKGNQQQKSSNQYKQTTTTGNKPQTQSQTEKTASQNGKSAGNKKKSDTPQRNKFFSLCDQKKIGEKWQKVITEFYTTKQSRADVTEEEYRQINEEIPSMSKEKLLAMAKTVQERKEVKDKQAS
jgi:hypothetical protein